MIDTAIQMPSSTQPPRSDLVIPNNRAKGLAWLPGTSLYPSVARKRRVRCLWSSLPGSSSSGEDDGGHSVEGTENGGGGGCLYLATGGAGM